MNVQFTLKSGKRSEGWSFVYDRKERHLNITHDAHAAVVLTKHTKEWPVFCDRKERRLNITHDAHAAVVLTKHTKEWPVFCDRKARRLNITHDAHAAVVLTKQGKGDILHMSEDALSRSSNEQSFWLSSEAMPYCTCTASHVRFDWLNSC